jgi:hypothetical protein
MRTRLNSARGAVREASLLDRRDETPARPEQGSQSDKHQSTGFEGNARYHEAIASDAYAMRISDKHFLRQVDRLVGGASLFRFPLAADGTSRNFSRHDRCVSTVSLSPKALPVWSAERSL